MIGKRTGKNCLKKFVFVSNKAQFDSIISVPSCYMQQKKQKNQQQIIIVPKWQIISSKIKPKNSQISKTYIKYYQNKDFMSKLSYELDQTDLCFINSHCPFIKNQIFSRIIIQLEKKGHKFGNQFKYKPVINRCLSVDDKAQIDGILSRQQKEQLLRKIYNFWRNKKKNIRSPLLRQFWTRTEVGPFKSRQDEANAVACLRNRTIKAEPCYINQVLRNDLLKLKNIFTIMRNRQISEINLLKIQTQSFVKSCKKIFKMLERQRKKQNKKERLTKKNKKILKQISQ